jgi:hypothetical protein
MTKFSRISSGNPSSSMTLPSIPSKFTTQERLPKFFYHCTLASYDGIARPPPPCSLSILSSLCSKLFKLSLNFPIAFSFFCRELILNILVGLDLLTIYLKGGGKNFILKFSFTVHCIIIFYFNCNIICNFLFKYTHSTNMQRDRRIRKKFNSSCHRAKGV